MKTFALLIAFICSFSLGLKAQDPLVGAWKSTSGEVNSVLLITPAYFSITAYHEKNFIATLGGTWKPAGEGQVDILIEFNTEEKSQVGQQSTTQVAMEKGRLTTTNNGEKTEWTRIDEGKGPLAGNWRISAREMDGKMNPIKPGARKTVKILTGKRFQWVAINTATGEFFGTGGGTYTFENGTYTENIDFFSRDSSRVGASLSFKGKVAGNNWDHSGLSSKGDPIHEVWSK
ncbi:hypothetical protein [Chitinophaga sp. MM2321]|uniref:hypothetical protein n=1 Tax=Chitinophaga sp. MM2321 TaxID=3137178 RepID=UPI0032D59290